MTITADSAAGNGRLRASSGTEPPPLVVPLGVSLEISPARIPLPAKIRSELLDPIDVEHDPQRAGDFEYVDRVYREVQAAIRAGMNRLAACRRFPVFG